MLCACSGEQFKFEDPPPTSPESLVTRDFSASVHSSRTPRDLSTVSGLSSRTRTPRDFSASGIFSRTHGDQLAAKLEEDQVDEVESTLKEALSLNYEEARALLGRMEYQKGNFTAAIQLFQGIDIGRLTPRIVKSFQEQTKQRRSKSKGGDDNSYTDVMSMPSVSLLLEAIFLKSKTMEELGRFKDAAEECKIILDIVESALPNGMPKGTALDSKMQEIFHKALELLPELWKQAGCLDEAIISYRRALVRPWNLSPLRLASVQKELACLLLYGGIETTVPSHLKMWGPTAPKSNFEEAILLLFVLMSKIASQQIDWDPEVMDHLTFALSMCGGFSFLADHIEQLLPGVFDRTTRWYTLALSYCASGQDDVALNLIRKAVGKSESHKHKPHLPSLLLGAKLCSENPECADDGIIFARQVIDLARDGCDDEHFLGHAHKFLGICYGNAARISISNISNTEREVFHSDALDSLNCAFAVDDRDPELVYSLGLENAVQRNLNSALEYTMLHSNMVGESSGRGWKLLSLVLSAQLRLKDAETIVDLGVNESDEIDSLELLRLKGKLQIAQHQPKQAIETYGLLLSRIQALKRQSRTKEADRLKVIRNLEVKSWHDLAEIYSNLEAWSDADICVGRAKSVDIFDPRSWHAAGMLMKAKSEDKAALVAYFMALSIEAEHVPTLVSMAKVLMDIDTNALPIARSFLMNALRVEPTNHEAWFNLGVIAKREGLTIQAADYFQAAHELESSAPVQPFV